MLALVVALTAHASAPLPVLTGLTCEESADVVRYVVDGLGAAGVPTGAAGVWIAPSLVNVRGFTVELVVTGGDGDTVVRRAVYGPDCARFDLRDVREPVRHHAPSDTWSPDPWSAPSSAATPTCTAARAERVAEQAWPTPAHEDADALLVRRQGDGWRVTRVLQREPEVALADQLVDAGCRATPADVVPVALPAVVWAVGRPSRW